MNRPIGVFDSGMGGITILSKLRKYLPHENFIYYGDSLHNPYGDKTNLEIQTIILEGIEFLKNKNCKAIVIACNTASSVAIDLLRKKYQDIIFISTLPALKVAMDEDIKQNVLVMATNATINSNKFLEIYNKYKEEHNHIYLLPCSGLAELIEETRQEEITTYLNKHLTPYKDKNINTIVLGCTHYPLIQNNIKEIIDCKLIDGSDGISRQLKRKLEEFNLLNKETSLGTLEVYNSTNLDSLIKRTYDLLEKYEKMQSI